MKTARAETARILFIVTTVNCLLRNPGIILPADGNIYNRAFPSR